MNKPLRSWPISVAIVLATLAASSASADVTISTITGTGPNVNGPGWDGTNLISPWGTVSSGATPTYGETFIDPAGNPFLQSVTFEINNNSGASIPFQAYVFSWTGTAITGSALFTSAVMSVPSATGFQAITVDTSNTALVPGNQYIAFYSTLGEGGSAAAASSWGYMQSPPGDTAYTNGSFWFNNSTTFPPLFSPNATWSNFANDLAFSFSFVTSGTPSTPEPSAAALAVLGMTMVGVPVLVRRRFRKAG